MADATTDTGIFVDNNSWWENYGLSHDPFAADIPHNAIYLPNSWEQYVDLMQLLVRHSFELLLVYGDIGSGKTTLLNYFLEQLDDSLTVCRIKATPHLNMLELLETINVSLGLNIHFDEQQTVRVMVNALVDAINQRNERSMLVIDDAHKFNNDTLSALFYLQQQRLEKQVPLAMVWALDTQNEERVQALMNQYLDRSHLKIIRVMPLELAESEAYLQHRFHQAGLQGNLPMEREDVIHIQQWSGGLPGRINNVARKVMVDLQTHDEFAEQTLPFWQQHQAKFIGGAVLFAVLIAGFYIWNTQQNFNYSPSQTLAIPPSANVQNNNSEASNQLGNVAENSASTTPAPTTTPVKTVAAIKPVMDHEVTTGALKQESLAQVTQAQQQMTQALQNPPPVAKQVAENNSTLQNYAETQSSPATTTDDTAKPAHVAPSLPAPAEAKLTPAHQDNKKPATVAEKQIAAPQPQPSAAPHSEEKAVVQSSQQKTTHKNHAVVAKKASSTNLHHASKLSHATRYTLDERELLKAPAKEYTLQLVGLRNLDKLKRYSQRAGLKNAKYFVTHHAGGDWYVLVYGTYPTRAAAERAIKTLPQVVRQQKPWIRSMASVHEAIKSR
ncbi:MAG: AAA family ATPase [Legionellales bacterium]|nr:AAA family ATPase [Legionellales bacterium]